MVRVRREVNWYSIVLPLCEELCVPAYMNWSEEFVSPKLGYSEVHPPPFPTRQQVRGMVIGKRVGVGEGGREISNTHTHSRACMHVEKRAALQMDWQGQGEGREREGEIDRK